MSNRNRKNNRCKSEHRTSRLKSVEALEDRRMLASSLELAQEFVYRVNLARSNPPAYSDTQVLGSAIESVEARQPLAINQTLTNTAQAKANEMNAERYFAHASPSGEKAADLIAAKGYEIELSSQPHVVESLANGLETPRQTVRALIIDDGVVGVGHRKHLLGFSGSNALTNEIGVGYNEGNNYPGVGHLYVAHATRQDSSQAFLTGVVYNDANGDSRFNAGEGLGRRTVSVNGKSVTTNAAGGWSTAVDDGTYIVESLGTRVAVEVVGQNVAVDFEQGTEGGWVDFKKVGPEIPNRAPTEVWLSSSAVEDHRPGASVGEVRARDPDAGDTHTIEVLGDDRFQISGRKLRLKDGVSLDWDTEKTIDLSLKATDGDGASVTTPFTIYVLQRFLGQNGGGTSNSAPTEVWLSSSAVEDHRPGASVGEVRARDPDAGDTHTIEVLGDDRFQISGRKLRLKDGVSLDWDAEKTIELSLKATDGDGASVTTPFTIYVLQRFLGQNGGGTSNSAPTEVWLSSSAVEDHRPGASVGEVRARDPDAGDTHTIEVLGDDRFQISGRKLRLKDGVSLDWDTEKTIELSLKATDGDGASVTTPFTIYVLQRFFGQNGGGTSNRAPTEVWLSSSAVEDHRPGASVGEVRARDPDAGDTHTIEVLGDDRFQISGRKLRLKDGVSLDWDTEKTIDLSLKATDGDGASVTTPFTIYILQRFLGQNGGGTSNSAPTV